MTIFEAIKKAQIFVESSGDNQLDRALIDMKSDTINLKYENADLKI